MSTSAGSTLDLTFEPVTSADQVHSSGCHLVTKCIINPYSLRHLRTCGIGSVSQTDDPRSGGIALRHGSVTTTPVALSETMFFRVVPHPANVRLTDVDDITVRWRSRVPPTAQGFRDRDFVVLYQKIAAQPLPSGSSLTQHPYNFKEAVPDSELPEWYRAPGLGFRTHGELASELRPCTPASGGTADHHSQGVNAILTLPSSVRGQAFCMIPRGQCDLVSATFSISGARPAKVKAEAFARDVSGSG